jgi:hypothetical protein
MFIYSFSKLIEFIEIENGTDLKKLKKFLNKIKESDKYERDDKRMAKEFIGLIKEYLPQYFGEEENLSFLKSKEIIFDYKNIYLDLSKEFKKLDLKKVESFDDLFYTCIYDAVTRSLKDDNDITIIKLRNALKNVDSDKKPQLDIKEIFDIFKSSLNKYKNTIDTRKSTKENMKNILQKIHDDEELLDSIDDMSTRVKTIDPKSLDLNSMLNSMGISEKDKKNFEKFKHKITPNLLEQVSKTGIDVNDFKI